MRKTLSLILALAVIVSIGSANPVLEKKLGEIMVPPTLDTFDDTISYDDNQPYWWYGGQTNFNLATKFTPLAGFEFQAFGLAFTSTGTVSAWLKTDNAGLPGTIIGGPWTVSIPAASQWRVTIVDTTGLPQYQFDAGENFWVEINSPGPPWETFDQAATIPQRSYLKWSTSTTYAPAPGDNFIRAIGEYSGNIIDVAVDSVWHGMNYFVTNGTAFQMHARVRNASVASPASFSVGCRIYTEVNATTYTYFDSLALQNVMLAPGASTTVNFPNYTWNTNNRYRIDVKAYYTGDVNPDNNTASTETQVFTAPPPNVTLRYDDTDPENAAYTSSVGDAWGQKFNPHLTGSYNIAQVHVNVSATVADSSARIRVLSDNAGVPGSVIWQTVSHLSDGWNDFVVNVSNTGSFYVMYVFEYGALCPALSLDGYPGAYQGWNYTSATATYEPDLSANDWGLRATLGSGTSYPNFTVDFTYVSGSPVPPGGGQIIFNIYMLNASGSAQNFDAWLATQFGTSNPVTVVMRSFTNFQAGWAINRSGMFYPIPGSYAAGSYTFYARCGDEPSVIWAQDSFPFTKSGMSDGMDFVPFAVDGAPNPFDVIDTGEAAVASEFALNGAYPNPFNPSTTLSFSLNNSSVVKLSVFDVTGREVAVLVDGYRDAGSHQASFDASSLASGIYIAKLSSGDQTAISKLVLMK